MSHNAAKARARLVLRGEAAMGLRSVRRSARRAPAEQPDAAPPLPASPPAANQPAKVSPQKSQTNLAPIPVIQPFDAPMLGTDEKRRRLLAMNEKEVRACTLCGLSLTRTNTVFGEGDVDAAVMFIGEGPGETEDQTGRPFVGRAGEMLNKWIAAMGLRREQVYIANIVKCRPPQNREPAADEVATCTPYLQRQIEIIRPKVIVTLGRPAAQHMLQEKVAMNKIRGIWKIWRGIKWMPTFHPAYVLRQYTPQTRAAVWSDLQMVMAELDLPLPKKSS